MTFLEAAIEILRHTDRAMHFSEVARLAVERNLLSHVGRDPEAAMRSCLNSAVRGGRAGQEAIIIREKPGHYGIRPGANLPDPVAPPPAPEIEKKLKDSEDSQPKSKVKSKSTKTRVARSKTKASAGHADDADPERGRHGRRRSRRIAEPPEVVPVRRTASGRRVPAPGAEPGPTRTSEQPIAARELPNVEFAAPSGSGLDGITDVALVMANAMSRIVEERPELRTEFDAMQQQPPPDGFEPRVSRHGRERDRPEREERSRNGREDDRSNRKRRRRRRRGRRVDWSGGGAETESEAGGKAHERLLSDVASVLEDAGARSLHVRQIAENLANRGILGGEISEIERAVTAALLLDVRSRGDASRFSARGDARYELRGSRLPEGAAKAEQNLRLAAQQLESETEVQIIRWLQSLGSRSLESLVRIYLAREGFHLISVLPANRGAGRLVVEDPYEDGRQLVLVIPKRCDVDAKLLEGEAERNNCAGTVVFAMGEAPNLGDDVSRYFSASEFGAWLREHNICVDRVKIEVAVLDPTIIESIAGLDT